jgi:hypothetical protein
VFEYDCYQESIKKQESKSGRSVFKNRHNKNGSHHTYSHNDFGRYRRWSSLLCNAVTFATAIALSFAHSNPHAHTDAYAYSNAHADAFPYANSYAYGNPYAHTNTDTDATLDPDFKFRNISCRRVG